MQSVPSEFLAIDRKSRLRVPFLDIENRPAQERICDFDDVVIAMDEERARLEAARCIHCPDPAPCVEACPAHNDIPSAMWLIEQGEFIQAARLYRETSSMPEICGSVCPHEQLCQGSCVRNKNAEPVLTGALEAFVTTYERQSACVEIPVPNRSGKKVAIVGTGPAGMACAEQLLRRGHEITFLESKPAPGGLLLYGIPNFKLPKSIVSARWEDLERAGARFIGNTFIGRDKSVDDLFAEGFDAVFLGVGSEIDAPMNIDGEELPGVYQATEFLIRANVSEEFIPPGMDTRLPVLRNVAVIGGGDTASDCLRSAIRLGAETVTCLYRRTEKEMPGGVKDRKLAREEGADYRFLTQPIGFIPDESGHLAQIECIEMELGEPDDSGRRRPVPIEGSNFIIEADTAILALGYWPDPVIGETTPGLETHKWGLFVVDSETGATSKPGVYAGGDDVTGPDLVVTAMVAGRKSAAAIDKYLQTKPLTRLTSN